jgi:hypothetical protein
MESNNDELNKLAAQNDKMFEKLSKEWQNIKPPDPVEDSQSSQSPPFETITTKEGEILYVFGDALGWSQTAYDKLLDPPTSPPQT